MRQILLIVLAFTLMSSGRNVQLQDFDVNAKQQAIFVYNFTKYIEWPESYKEGSFIIGLLGETPLYSELQKMAAKRKAVSQPFEIKKFSDIEDIDRCHMLFISNGKQDSFGKAVKKVNSYSTLVIGENEGLAERGAGINFVIKNNRQRFELNKNNIENRKLKVSHQLLSLAILVE